MWVHELRSLYNALIYRLWCWEGLGARGEGDDRGWDGWMASLTWWTWASVNLGSWWWTGRPGMLRFMGSRRVGHDWATDLIWIFKYLKFSLWKLLNTWTIDWIVIMPSKFQYQPQQRSTPGWLCFIQFMFEKLWHLITPLFSIPFT